MATLIFPAILFATTVLGTCHLFLSFSYSMNMVLRRHTCERVLSDHLAKTNIEHIAQCSTSGTTTITASADATALASCTTYSGSVAIPTGLAVPKDNDGLQVLQVDNIRKITGNLTVTNIGELASLTFGSLQSVFGFELGALERLATLSFPQLASCDALNFTALPSLQTLNFGGTGITKARSVLITNTGLSTLNGIENLQEVDLFNVNNNQALTNISLKVTSIKNSLNVEANDGFVSGLSTSFPLLETAQNMTFRNCSQILLPSLKNVTDELGFYGNTFTNFSAPKLTSAGGIIFVDNTELINITLPNLEKIDGAYQIANNTKLSIINGFQKLSVIKGTLDFSGNFSK
jgi:hypothetical protein